MTRLSLAFALSAASLSLVGCSGHSSTFSPSLSHSQSASGGVRNAAMDMSHGYALASRLEREREFPRKQFHGKLVNISPTIKGFTGAVTFTTTGQRLTGVVSAIYYTPNGFPRIVVNHAAGDYINVTAASGMATSTLIVRIPKK